MAVPAENVRWTHLEIKRGWRWITQYGTYPDTNGTPGAVRSVSRGVWMASYSPHANRYYSGPCKERRRRHVFVCVFTNMREKPRAPPSASPEGYIWLSSPTPWLNGAMQPSLKSEARETSTITTVSSSKAGTVKMRLLSTRYRLGARITQGR